jgi:hypothetical protein
VTQPLLQVWAGLDGLWYWRFVDQNGQRNPPLALRSSEGYLDADKAVQAAQTAFPGVRVQELTPPRRRAPRWLPLLLMAGAAVVVVALARRGPGGVRLVLRP